MGEKFGGEFLKKLQPKKDAQNWDDVMKAAGLAKDDPKLFGNMAFPADGQAPKPSAEQGLEDNEGNSL